MKRTDYGQKTKQISEMKHVARKTHNMPVGALFVYFVHRTHINKYATTLYICPLQHDSGIDKSIT
jgi:hypothetical protein